ncbi:hypothetical protein JCM11641_003581 [Rhodosporidiobolus odoratus]
MANNSPSPTSSFGPPQPSPLPRQQSTTGTPSRERERRSEGSRESSGSASARRASSPPATRPSRLRQSIHRLGSSFSSIAESSRPESTASTSKQPNKPSAPKKQRPRPANLAGPSTQRISAIPDALFRENDRTPGSSNGSYDASSSGNGRSGEEKDGGKNKPVFAMGGVFPKHARKRRKSSVARDAEGNEEDRRGRGREPRSDRRPPSARRISSTALNTDSSTSSSAVRAPDSVARYEERGDPFDDLDRRNSKLEVFVSRDDPSPHRSLHSLPESRSDVHETDEAQEDAADNTEHASTGTSPTLAEEQSRSQGQGNQQAPLGGPLPNARKSPGHRPPPREAEPGESTDHDDDDVHSAQHHSTNVDAEQAQEDEKKGGKDKRKWPKDGGEQPGIGGELNQDSEQWKEDLAQQGEDLPIRNWWGTIRFVLREPLAEFLGTLVLIVIGIGSDCQTKISENTMGAYSSMNWSWGFAVMTSIYIAGGISGGHTNPSVTIVLAIFRGFPWKLVPRYIVAQVFGAFCGALIIYGNYMRAIVEYDPNKLIHGRDGLNASATLFITAPATQVGGTAQGFCQEVLASGILTIAVLALGDENNAPPGAGLGAIVLGFIVVAIGMSNGWISGYAINIARDLGPRFALWCIGYGTELWTHDDWWWLAGAICGPMVGGIAGALAYDLCIFTGPGSPVNYSMYELSDACGLPRMHNMVRMVVQPSYRRRRLSTARTQNPDDLAETGMAPTSLARERSETPHPGRLSQQSVNEMRLHARLRKGREKISKEEDSSRRRTHQQRNEWRKSIEELRERERQRDPIRVCEIAKAPSSNSSLNFALLAQVLLRKEYPQTLHLELTNAVQVRSFRRRIVLTSLLFAHLLLAVFRHPVPFNRNTKATMAIQSIDSSQPTATYPPQNSLQMALNNQSTVTVALDERDGQCHASEASGQTTGEQEGAEAMRLRGGCFNMGLCG